MSLNESGRHSREFMLKAVERLVAGERASALAIELNLNRMIIYHWRDRFRANGVVSVSEDDCSADQKTASVAHSA